MPLASSLNYDAAGVVVGNELVAKLNDAGQVCLFSSAETHLTVDVVGYVPVAASAPSIDLLFEPGWRLEPGSVTFTADGQSETVRLVHYGEDGRPSGRAIPDGTELGFSNEVFDTERIDGGFVVRGGETIGSTLVIARLPDGSASRMWVSGVRLASGVVELPGEQVVLPPPADAAPVDLGPFTEAELESRTSADLDGPILNPVVISGAAPATGTMVVAAGQSPVVGRVIEPNGLPTIERAGLTLLTLEIPALDEVYDRLDVRADIEELSSDGFIDDAGETYCYGERCAPGDTLLGSTDSLAKIASPIKNQTGLSTCAKPPKAGATFGEVKFVFETNASPIGNFDAVVNGPNQTRINFQFGIDLSVKAGVEGKAAVGVSASIECDLKDFPDIRLPFPGPLAPVLAGVISPKIVGSVSAGVTAGPKVEFKATREYKKRVVGGYIRNASGTVERVIVDGPLTQTDEFGVTPDDGGVNAGSIGANGQLEVKGGIFLAAEVGIRLGGQTVEWLGELFGEEELGLIQPIQAKLGPEIGFKWERVANVFNNKKSGSEATLGLVGEVVFNSRELGGLLELLTKSFPGLTDPKFEFSLAKSVLAKPSGPDAAPKVTVLNESTDNVEIGDVVDVEFSLTEPEPTPAFASEPNDTVWAYRRGGPGEDAFVETDVFRWSTEPGKVTGSKLIDDDACEEFGDDGATYVVGIEEAAFAGLYFFPVYAGEFTIKCGTSIEFEPANVKLRDETGENTADVTIKQTGYGEDDSIEFMLPTGVTLPAGHSVTFTPSSVRLDADEKQVALRLDCPTQNGERITVDYAAQIRGETIEEKLPVELNCTDDFIDIVGDSSLEVPGGATVAIESEGADDTAWTPTGRMEADKSQPVPGFLPGRGSESDQPGVFMATTQRDPRKQEPIPVPCGKPGLTSLPEAKGPGGVTAPGRGSDSIIVVWEAKDGFPPEPEPCPPPPPPDPPGPPGGPGGPGGGGNGGPGGSGGGAWGDPHMTSFDGLRYDAQTRGEYVYAQQVDPDPDGPRVVARHEDFGSSTSLFAATVVTGVAVEQAGVKLEVTTRPPAVRLDGDIVEFPIGSYIEVSPGVFVGRTTAGTYRFTTTDIDVVIQVSSYLNVDVFVADDASIVGLLGLADGDPATDLLIRDAAEPIGNWDEITLADARAHVDEFFEFSDSWRLTDPADSPFTVPSDVFDQPNRPRPGSELLEPYREQARRLVAANSVFCDNSGPAEEHTIEVLAIEIAMGNEAGILTCEFVLSGSVRIDDPDTIAVGVEVEASAPGLVDCVTTTDTVGNWRCTTGPDPLSDPPSEVTYPYDVDVVARAVGSTDVAASAVVPLPQKAPFTGQLSVGPIALVIPAATATVVELSGTLESGNEPVTTPTTLELVGDDVDGNKVVGTRLTVVPDATGAYSEVVGLPLAVTELDVLWRIGIDHDHETATYPNLVPGLNELDFTRSYDPPLLRIAGQLRYNGDPAVGSVTVRATRPGFATPSTQTLPIAADASGSYVVETYVASTTTSVELIGTSGHPSNVVTSVLDAPSGGLNDVPLDIVVSAPRLVLSGSASVNGQVPNRFELRVDAVGYPRQSVGIWPDGSGDWDATFDLPAGVTTVNVTAAAGSIAADYPTIDPTGLVDGTNLVPFDVVVDGPSVAVSGRITGDGVPISGNTYFDVAATDASYATIVAATSDANGDYSFATDLPIGVDEVDITARAGFSVAARPTTRVAVQPSGVTSVAFDPTIDAAGVTFTGTLEIDSAAATGNRPLTVEYFDGDDDLVDLATVYAPVGSDGTYSVGHVAPPSAVRGTVSAAVGPWRAHRTLQAFSGLADDGTPTVVPYSTDAITHRLDVSGVMTADGAFVGGSKRFVVTVEATRTSGAPETLVIVRDVFVNPFNGEYSFVVEIPETSTSASIVAEIGADPIDYPTIAVPTIETGTTVVDFDGDAALPVDVNVTGVLADADGPLTGQATIRSILRENDGTVVATYDDVVDVVDGEFQLAFSERSDTNEILLSWLVGIPGESPVVRTFTGLTPGDNEVAFAEVYDPPIIEIDGVATRNGAPIAGDATIDLAVSRDGGGSVSSSVDVTIDPVDGSFSYSETLLRDAVAVDVDVSVSDADDGTASATIDPLVGGSNEVSVELISLRPVLEVSGTMTHGVGPPTGNVTVVVAASDGASQNRSINVVVDPDDDDGSYDFELLLPMWATEATLTARIGPDASLWPEQTETGLVAGPNAVTFDPVVVVQSITVSGAATISGGDYPVPLQFYVSDNDPGVNWGRFVVADVVDGQYSFDLLTPSTVDSVRVLVRTGIGPYTAEDPEQIFSSLGAGGNALDFDVALRGRGVLVSGRLTDSSSGATVPVTTSQQFHVDSRIAANAQSNFSTSYTISPDANGDFTTFFIVPDNATVVGHGTRIGPNSGDLVRQVSAGIGDGVNAIVHDDDYDPPKIVITGNLRRDGDPLDEDALLRLGGGGFAQVSVTPEANGDIAGTILAPRDRVGTTVDVQWINASWVSAEDIPAVRTQTLVDGDNPLTFVWDRLTTTVTLSGTIEYRGVARTGLTNIDVYMSSTEGSPGTNLGERNVAVYPDEFGYYETTFAVASDSETVNAVILLGGFYSDPYERFSVVVDTTPGQNTVDVLDAQTTSLELDGTVTYASSGTAFVDEYFTVSVVADDAGDNELDTFDEIDVYTDGNGEYELELFLPPGTASVEISPDLPGTDPFDIAITSSPGLTTDTHDFTTAGGLAVTVQGVITDSVGVADPTIEVVGYSSDDYGFGPIDWYEESRAAVPYVFFDPAGDYTGDSIVDPIADFVEVVVTFSDGADDTVYRRTFDVRFETAPYVLDVDIEHNDDRLEWSGTTEVFNPDPDNTYCESEGMPFMFRASLTAYVDQDSVTDGDPSNDLEVASTIVLPTNYDELTGDDWAFASAVPAGYGYLIVGFETYDFYDPNAVDANYGYGVTYAGGVDESPFNLLDASCVGEPIDF
jgi:VWD domain-containing protein